MSRSRSRAQEDEPSSCFLVAKYTSMGCLSAGLIWTIIFDILLLTKVVYNSCKVNADAYEDLSTGQIALTIILLIIFLACVVGEFIVIICEVFWAVVTFAVLQGLYSFGCMFAILCTPFYAIHLLLSLITMGLIIWYSVELYQAQNVNRGRVQDGGYVISVPGQQQQQPYQQQYQQPQYQQPYQQQQVFQVGYQMQPNSKASSSNSIPSNA